MYDINLMHYGFRRRANKVDSLQNRNFYVEQIDDYLNEALNSYVNELLKVAEYNKSVDDSLQVLLKTDTLLPIEDVTNSIVKATLPVDYLRHVRSYSKASAECCNVVQDIKHYRIQGDDENAYIEDPLYKPSYLYRETGYRIVGNTLRILKGELDIQQVFMDYYAKHPRLGNPNNARTGAYNLADGTPAVQQSLLFTNPKQADIIMDLAVLASYVDTNNPTFQNQVSKMTSMGSQ